MLGSNPSADSVASTDVGGCCASPFHLLIAKVPTIGRGNQALNPGGAGAKPPPTVLAAHFLLKAGRPPIMHSQLETHPGDERGRCPARSRPHRMDRFPHALENLSR